MSPISRNADDSKPARGRTLIGAGSLVIAVDTIGEAGVSGEAGPNAIIEGVNRSVIPAGRYRPEDTVVIGRADGAGRFVNARLQGEQAMREGDFVQLRARFESGEVSEWFAFRANGLEASDTRNAVVALSRIGLFEASEGVVELTNIGSNRPISEPGATLVFSNERTREVSTVTLDASGSFERGASLKGRAGDFFSLSATDGRNALNPVGRLRVPGAVSRAGLAAPAPRKDGVDATGRAKFDLVRFSGPLFEHRPRAEDVVQGQLGDCAFATPAASTAHADPAAIERLITDNKDGTYTVRLYELDAAAKAITPADHLVEPTLYVRPSGEPIYGRASNSSDPNKMVLWFALLEKAYAQSKRNGYDTVGSGGTMAQGLLAIYGVRPRVQLLRDATPDAVWANITKAVDAHKPIGASTGPAEPGDARYANSRVFAGHGYSVLNYAVVDGQRRVTVRNPWGESEPNGDGQNDGVFELSLETFIALHDAITFIE